MRRKEIVQKIQNRAELGIENNRKGINDKWDEISPFEESIEQAMDNLFDPLNNLRNQEILKERIIS